MKTHTEAHEQDCAWYYRDKSQDGEPQLFWCATWPEGQQGDGVNFIAQLYFTAPDRASALREFCRWAFVRMQDVPYVVLEQVDAAEVPKCPHPRADSCGLALPDRVYKLR
jgi:hypothetical protein